MKLTSRLSLLCWLVTSVIASDGTNENDKEIDVELLHSQVPEPLTINNFDETLKEGFNMVEFFSPYCPHCVNLFPTWANFYLNNEKLTNDNKKYNIYQVDCVMSGDLCEREGIHYYPMIRFYGPDSRLLASMTDSVRTIDTLTEFADDQLLTWNEDFIETDDTSLKIQQVYSSNRLLDNSELMRIIEGENQVPYLITFWPTTFDQLNDKNFQNKVSQHVMFKHFESLFEFRSILNLTIKKMKKFIEDDNLRFGYFNCASSKEICKELGLSNLITGSIKDNTYPKAILYLPKDTGGNAIKFNANIGSYKGINLAAKSLSNWIESTLINSELRDMKFNEIKNFIGGTVKLEQKGRISEFTDYSKVAIIQVNDPTTKSYEDDIILEHLIQPIANLNNDVFLFKTTDNEIVERFLLQQEKNLANSYIHPGGKIDESIEDNELQFNEKMYISRTHTSYPYYICLKAGTLYTPVLQTYGSEDSRNVNKVVEFIKKNYLPAVTHLTLETEKTLFPNTFDKMFNDKNEKVIIALTDFQPKQFFDVEYFLSYVYHKFTLLNNHNLFNKLEEKRATKHEKVAKMKKKDASSDDIIDALREKIDINFSSIENNVHAAYIDIKNWKSIVKHMNWTNIKISDYGVGDVLIVERFGGRYWDHDVSGNKITIDNEEQCLKSLEAATFKNLKSKNLKDASFFTFLLFYGAALVLFLVGFRYYKQWSQSKKHYNEKMKGLGLLGLTPEFEESKFD